MENKITFHGGDSKKSNTKKDNVKKIIIRIVNIFCYIATIFLAILLIVSFTYKPNKTNVSIPHLLNRKVDNIQLVEDNPTNVIYDDDNEEITINSNELNNYTWINFNNYLYNHVDGDNVLLDDIISTITYNEVNYSYVSDDKSSDNIFYFVYQVDGNNQIIFNNGYDDNTYEYKFSITSSNEFEYSISFEVRNNRYNAVKNAIELDIQANEEESSPTISIFEGITSSITSFISTLNSGITAIIGIFWANNSLTPIGILTTIVVGVSIVYFIFSLVIGLIRLRG